MKYLLIEHRGGGDPALLTICDTPEARERLTRETIYGDETAPCPELEDLRENGIVYFEGDPPLQWLTVCAIWRSDSEPKVSANGFPICTLEFALR